MDYLTTVNKNINSYIDYNVINGTTYYYQISATDNSNNQSARTAQVSATPTVPGDITPPATPMFTSVTVFQGGVKLEWTQNTEIDLANYNVYRSKINDFGPSMSNKIAIVNKLLTEYNDIINVESLTDYFYKLSAVDNSGNESGFSNQATVTTLNLINDNLQSGFFLKQNTPNPFNPNTEIEFSIPLDNDINVVIYDLMGDEIKTLINEYKQAGQYTINWDGNDNLGRSVGGGIYFYKLKAGDFIQTRKMVLLK